MKTGKIVMVIMSMVVGSLVYGQGHDHDKSTMRPLNQDKQGMSSGHMMVSLPSVQCGMCQDKIESGLKEVDGIQSVHVDLDKKMGHVNYNPEKISEAEIEKMIAGIGYWANDVPADPKAYTKLDGCCQMSEKEYDRVMKTSMHNPGSPHKMGKESKGSHMSHQEATMEMDGTSGSSSGGCGDH